MTEEEAKTKACCKGTAHPITISGSCIASGCMAWRERPVMREKRNAALGAQEQVGVTGWCGLAGAPS